MSTAKEYRKKAAEYAELLKTASVPSEAREFRNLEQSFITLTENDQWLADNLGKTNGPGADDNRYDDVLIPRQEKNALGAGAVEPLQSTEIPTKIQQLFDDAGPKGGLLQPPRYEGKSLDFYRSIRTTLAESLPALLTRNMLPWCGFRVRRNGV